MRHEQLQDLVDDYDCAGSIEEPAVHALRAVVELHRPYESTDAGLLCRHCVDEGAKSLWYPCPTIRVIEEVLA